MSEWLELEISTRRPNADTAMMAAVDIQKVSKPGLEELPITATAFYVPAPAMAPGDDVQAWTVAVVGAIYAELKTRYEARKNPAYPMTASTT